MVVGAVQVTVQDAAVTMAAITTDVDATTTVDADATTTVDADATTTADADAANLKNVPIKSRLNAGLFIIF